ncbi:MAG: hypothetical protein CLLPBCKN_008601 [Chroococcidiopsis cubana SAG 39.79]|nr:hypothetical protein [Chroococcidiopsis cubana SAG 39.79]
MWIVLSGDVDGFVGDVDGFVLKLKLMYGNDFKLIFWVIF